MIVFLDCDGVLNHSRMDWTDEPYNKDAPYVADPECVERFERLIKELDATWVVSSTWRVLNDRQFFIDRFGPFLASKLEEDWATKKLGSIRGLEVREWLDRNKGYQFKDYMILDDDQDFLWYQPLVLCDHRKGFDEETLQLALKTKGIRKYDI